MSVLNPLKSIENINEIIYGIKLPKKKEEPIIIFEDTSKAPPIIYKSKAETAEQLTYKIDPQLYFLKSGLLLYTKYKDELIFFLAVFTGTDREKIIAAELCDFGGKVESNENFIQGAIHETLEESLGVFNFVNQENEIASISKAVFTLDRAIIYLLTPIIIDLKPLKYVELFKKRRNEISSITNTREFISKIEEYNYPKLDLKNKKQQVINFLSKFENKRKTNFNHNEIRDIVYISHSDLIKLVNNETVPLPEKLAKILNMENYPKLYFAVADRLRKSSVFEKLN